MYQFLIKKNPSFNCKRGLFYKKNLNIVTLGFSLVLLQKQSIKNTV